MALTDRAWNMEDASIRFAVNIGIECYRKDGLKTACTVVIVVTSADDRHEVAPLELFIRVKTLPFPLGTDCAP